MTHRAYPSIIALIPARSGSRRVPGKNIRTLAGHPLIAYTISSALQSGIFDRVVVSTDSDVCADIARHYGADVPFLRPMEYSGDLSPDIEWVDYTLKLLGDQGHHYDCFSILRPTSPFRMPATIQRAWKSFLEREGIDSLRAVEKCTQHPGKMWVVRGHTMTPLLPLTPSNQPWHSCQYQALPEVYVQNASLEIARTSVVFQWRTIAGWIIMPFFTKGYEGFDVNQLNDWELAKALVQSGKADLPDVAQIAYEVPEVSI